MPLLQSQIRLHLFVAVTLMLAIARYFMTYTGFLKFRPGSINLSSVLCLIFAVFLTCFSTDAKAEINDDHKQHSQSQKIQISGKSLDFFSKVITLIKHEYVQDISDNSLLDNALQGMLSGLDPHSSYLSPQDYLQSKENHKNKVPGIGVEVINHKGFLKVISPYSGSPAFKAGIRPGDLIVAIDDISTAAMNFSEACDKLRGEAGTKVKISVLRNENDYIDFIITREILEIPSVETRLIADNGLLYVKISSFGDNTTESLISQYHEIKKNHDIRGLILDLRNNPGGLLEQAIAVSNLFLNRGRIVVVKSRNPAYNQTFSASGEDITHGLPIVILINNGSASGAEVLAAALQDNKRAQLVGTTSFGKGSVQNTLPLSNGGAIIITTALYYAPSGRSIQAQGITPDIIVPEAAVIKTIQALPGIITSESQLSRHIQTPSNAGNVRDSLEDRVHSMATQDLSNDFQLSRAMDVLQTMIFLRNNQPQSNKTL